MKSLNVPLIYSESRETRSWKFEEIPSKFKWKIIRKTIDFLEFPKTIH
jgi:hypothetical protein